MEIKTIYGEFCNVYVIESNVNIIIDAGVSASMLPNINVDYVFLTHAHYDHLAYLNDYAEKFPNATFLMAEQTYNKLDDCQQNVANLFGVNKLKKLPINRVKFVKEGDKIEALNEPNNFVELKGHTNCSMGLIVIDNIFCGDAVFENGYGRYDLPTGDFEQTQQTLEKINKLNNIRHFYSGHGTPFDKN